MILHTEHFGELAGLVAARLTQSAVGESTLELEFAGHVPTRREDAAAWLEYDEPVTVMHCGRALYHGKVTAYERSASVDGRSTRVTVTDVWSIFERAPLAAQIAEIEAGIRETERDVSFEEWARDKGYWDLFAERQPWEDAHDKQARWRAAALEYADAMWQASTEALTSWEELARSFAMAAPGWAVAPDGTPLEEATLVMDCTRANYSMAGRWTRGGVVSPWQALQRMREANPDCFYLARPDGVLEVVSLGAAMALTLESGGGGKIIEAAGIAPRFADAWAGVAVILTDESGSGAVLTRVYPEGVSLEDTRVKVLTGSGGAAAMAVMYEQAVAWWKATNMLQYDGTVRVAMSALSESPLGRKLNLTGASMAPEWGEMEAIIGGVEWDFVSGVVTLTLGVSVEDPQLAEIETPTLDVPDTETERSSSSSEEESDSKMRGSEQSSSSSSEELCWHLPFKSSEESSEDTQSDCGRILTDALTDSDCCHHGESEHETEPGTCCHHGESEQESELGTCCPSCKGLAERVAALEKWKEEVMAWIRHIESAHCGHVDWWEWAGVNNQPQNLMAEVEKELKITTKDE